MAPTQPAAPEPDSLAEAIAKIAGGFDRLQKSGLNRKAIVILLNDWTGVGKRDIERVLSGLADLPKVYCRPQR
ncbi:hypothetical protein [Bradyrhizobium uaiense]|uniref:Uncharacterized protein n=1 Tax=Bradyrhizobium uaiense TaxID=2594946 RepID=A0A6P1BAY5_9BRAD|nr:hypothetical protein [Bradyrhizobium uaiense]NEU94791.1 hypothetical protein [Bradyrhizobium uaiense]